MAFSDLFPHLVAQVVAPAPRYNQLAEILSWRLGAPFLCIYDITIIAEELVH